MNSSISKSRPVSVLFRALSLWLAVAQAVLPVSNELSAATPSARSTQRTGAAPTQSEGKKTGLLPDHERHVGHPVFSRDPSDFEFRQPVLGRALFPTAQARDVMEDRRLAAALLEFYELRNPEATEPIEAFLHAHPKSRWRPSLLLNLGRIYHHTAKFSNAFQVWEQAWLVTKDSAEHNSIRLANEAAALLAEMYVFLGRQRELGSLLEETKGRALTGEFAASIANSRIANWQMVNEPEVTFKCGPMALGAVRGASGSPKPYAKEIADEPSTDKGTSLEQMWRLSERMQMNYQIAWRPPGASVLVPAMVHWKLDHYSALDRQSEGRFHVQDSTFQQQVWVSSTVLDEEASGYFLVPQGPLPEGWRAVNEAEAKQVWGRAAPNTPDKYATHPLALTAKDDCTKRRLGKGQADYDMHLLLASLQIVDVPIGYLPPRGPQIDFRVTYNQSEATETGQWSNFGENWRFNWIAFISDNPNNPQSDVHLNTPSGGRITFSYQTTNVWKTQMQSHTRLTKLSSSSYEVLYPSGAKEIYEQPDLTNGVSRRVFLTRVMDAASNTVTLAYGANMRLLQVVDAAGKTNEITHGSSDTNDPLYHRIIKITDPFTREATFQYDTNNNNRLTNITDVINLKSRFTYSTNLITSMTTEYGTTKFHSYYEVDGHEIMKWIEVEDSYGEKERVEWRDLAPGIADAAPSNQVPPDMDVENDEMNRRNTFYWDKKAMREHPLDYTKARSIRFLKGAGFDVPGVPHSSHDPLENRIWITYFGQDTTEQVGDHNKPFQIGRRLDDLSTQTNTFEYDAFHNVTNYIDPVGRSTRFIYDANGIDLIRIRQVNGANFELLAKFEYNAQHLPTSYIDAAGQTNKFQYNANGQLTHFINALNQTNTWIYDTTGKLTSVTVSNATTSFTYDAKDRVRTVTDPEGYTLTFGYDNLDRITNIAYPGTDDFESFVYDKLDLAYYRDRNGRWTRNFYNANRQLIAVQDPLGRLTKFDWCGCGGLDSIIDPLGRVTSFIRDIQGRVTSKVYPDGTSVNFTYENTTSRLRSITDAKGQSKWFAYGKDDNLTQISYTNAPGTTNVTFVYDANYNRLVRMMDGIGGITNTYYTITNGTLGAGQLESIDGPFNNDVITFEYDKLGRVKQRDINGVAERYSYDALGRVSQLTNVLGVFNHYFQSNTFKLISNSYPNGQFTAFAYQTNDDRRLERIWNKKSDGSNISKFEYTYDDVGQITTWAQTLGSVSTNVWVMEYDRADQLRAVTITNGTTGAIVKRYGYAYDKAGNRTGEQIDDVPNQAGHNVLNQLTNIQSAGPTRFAGWMSETGLVTVDGLPATMSTFTNFVASVPLVLGSNIVSVIAWDSRTNLATNRYGVIITNSLPTTLKYDANGNLTNQYTSTYTNSYDWDGEDRLIRITRRSTADPVEYKTEFLYDGLGRRVQIIERTNGVSASSPRYLWCGTELCEARGSGGGTATRQYVSYGEHHVGVGLLHYTFDHLGSVRDVHGGQQGLRARYDYDPYGRRTVLSEVSDATFGYTGHFYHSGSGLHLAVYRALDSGAGRWLSKDPIGERGGINLYAYVLNDPVNRVDPLGWADIKLSYDITRDPIIPLSATRVHGIAGVAANAKAAVGPGDSIRLLQIGGHGFPGSLNDNEPGGFNLSANTFQNYRRALDNPDLLTIPNMKEDFDSVNALKDLANLMSGKGKVQIISCETFAKPEGRQLMKDLESIFGQGNVIGYAVPVKWHLFGGVSQVHEKAGVQMGKTWLPSP